MDLPRTPAIYRSSTRRSNVVLGGFLKHAGARRKHAESAMEGGIAGIAGSKVTNKWGLRLLRCGSEESVPKYLPPWRAGGQRRAAFSSRSFFDTKSCPQGWEPMVRNWIVVQILHISRPHGEADMGLVQLAY